MDAYEYQATVEQLCEVLETTMGDVVITPEGAKEYAYAMRRLLGRARHHEQIAREHMFAETGS